MLRSGKEHLESLRDGRIVYIGNEKVDDVTTHPAFRNAAQTVVALYDMKAEPALREEMTYEEDGGRHSIYFLRARSREDLQRRMIGHRRIADFTYGMFGRSPDHVSSFVTGMAMKADELDGPCGHPENLLAYYRHIRDNDVYTVYAVVPPQAARNPEFYNRQNIPVPTLRVVREDDDGVVISGMKMLATGAAFANEIWIGNVIPLAPDQKQEAITCAIPCNAPGLKLWSRQPVEHKSEFDSPLSYRYDESDSMLLCNEVKVPWERVFVHGDALLSRDIYIKTPSHCFGNHQSNVRYWAKMRLLVGLCSKIAQATGADQVPAVREALGRVSSYEAQIAGMVHGQINAYEADWPGNGHVCFNRRMMYGALEWCTQNYTKFVDELRELCGGGVFQMPANISVLRDPELARDFQTFWQTPQNDAVTRMKLFKLAWDMVGSEFAGRHLQYEKFYAGASFIVRNHAFRETDWAAFNAIVDDLMAGYDHGALGKLAAE